MAVTNVANGTATPTLDTPETLVTSTAAGVYVLTIDLSALTVGDILRVHSEVKTLVGSAAAEESSITFQGAQDHPVFQTKAILVEHSIAFVIEQTDGTARSFPWSVART